MATTDLHFVAGSLQPVKRGVRMLGGAVDDGIQVDAAGAALANVAAMELVMLTLCWQRKVY